MHTFDNEEDYLLICNLITTDNEENDEKNPIDPAKKPPSYAAQMETSIPSHIAALPIVAKTVPVFLSAKYPFRLS